ncbi:MAG TPA: alpha/beta hydrolase [Candidatus Binatia bacterium]|jgi:hypothetical protein
MLASLQRRFLYFPIRRSIASPDDYGLEYEDVSLKTRDGVTLHAWWLPVSPPARATARTALFLHGNAGNVSFWLPVARPFHELGWNTLIVDYRGYGRSGGRPSEEGTYLDADSAWCWLKENRGVDPSRIVVVGRSLGGGVATWLALERPVGALVLESTFTSIADVVASVLRVPGIRSVVRLGYPSLARMGRIDVPLLVFHGRGDDLIPIAQGRALHAAAAGPKRFVELTGGHNDAYDLDSKTYAAALKEFAAGLDAPPRSR